MNRLEKIQDRETMVELAEMVDRVIKSSSSSYDIPAVVESLWPAISDHGIYLHGTSEQVMESLLGLAREHGECKDLIHDIITAAGVMYGADADSCYLVEHIAPFLRTSEELGLELKQARKEFDYFVGSEWEKDSMYKAILVLEDRYSYRRETEGARKSDSCKYWLVTPEDMDYCEDERDLDYIEEDLEGDLVLINVKIAELELKRAELRMKQAKEELTSLQQEPEQGDFRSLPMTGTDDLG